MSVAIIGAGISGLTLALALAQRSQGQLPIHLIEKNPLLTAASLNNETRTLAISQGSCRILAQLGLWELIAPHATPIKQIEVSEQGHIGTVEITAAEYDLEALGYVIQLQQVLFKLQTALLNCTNVTLHSPKTVQHVQQYADHVELSLSDHAILHTDLLLLANGTPQGKDDLLPFEYDLTDLRQVAVVANVTTEQPNQGKAFERFTRQGPLAFLPVTQHQSAIVWCQNFRSEYDLAQHWNEAEFLNQLQHSFGWRLGKISEASNKGYFPLYQRFAKQISYHRVALLGNAAQTLHPVAGQGFNLALRDIDLLSRIVSEASLQQQDCGSFKLLQRYQQQRKPDRESLIQLTNGFINVFSNGYLPLQLLRSAGLILMSNHELLKHQLVRKMLG